MGSYAYERDRNMSAKRLSSTVALFSLVFAVGSSLSADLPTTSETDSTLFSSNQIEADWIRQDEVRGVVIPSEKVTPQEDAAGACDGVKDGTFGFHTVREDQPWWQIDLGRIWPLDEIFVFNRCNGSSARASSLEVLLSEDAKAWSVAYKHDGTEFYGWPDSKPLVIPLAGRKARYVRIRLDETNTCLHLDEIEVYPTTNHRNIALRMPATQSSISPYSRPARLRVVKPPRYSLNHVVSRGLLLAENLRLMEVAVGNAPEVLRTLAARASRLPADVSETARRDLYLQARQTVRKLAFSNPLLDFDDLLFVKRVPARFTTSATSRTHTHMSDQYYGWFSRPGGGLCVLEDWKSDQPRLRCLTDELPPGNIIRPDISFDGKNVLFAYCRYYPGIHELADKLDKSKIPEDAFYQLYELKLDGTGLRRLTHGKYDHFDGRYLPSGEIVFLSTRRGTYVQCGKQSVKTSGRGAEPDCYVRCGGDEYRPVAVYTLHVMSQDGDNLRQISPFEMFEWTPSITPDGRILYSRWDYVDRDAMPYMGLWSTMPDGTGTRAVFGNYTRSPHCMFEPRTIPGSRKIVFTASGHHSNTAGSLVLLDPSEGTDGQRPMTRLTPEVPFTEIEAWPQTYFANPYPVSEEHYLVAWSDQPLTNPGHEAGDAAMGVYLFDAFGNLNLIYRDPTISCMYPLPVKPRSRPQRPVSLVDWEGRQEGQVLLANVYEGLPKAAYKTKGSIRSLRLVGLPAKDHPVMNQPQMGLTRHDPGKFVLGTVPVESDGSANFRVPSGVSFFVQALDADGKAVQTMRSAIYVQPGEHLTCVGCHENRQTAPPNSLPSAAKREPSPITPGPAGSWPLDYNQLVQPVLERHCVGCHKPGGKDADFDLTRERSYDTIANFGTTSLKMHVVTRHRQGRSVAGACAAQRSELLALLRKGHYDVQLARDDWQRLITWMDTYGQRQGAFSPVQEEELRHLRHQLAGLLSPTN